MPHKILVGGEWYSEVSPRTHPEFAFTQVILQRGSELFPGFQVCRFEATVRNNYFGSKKPDLAIIDDLYRNWWVVEVELSHHP